MCKQIKLTIVVTSVIITYFHTHTHTMYTELEVPFPPNQPLDSAYIEWIHMGTTVATNTSTGRGWPTNYKGIP